MLYYGINQNRVVDLSDEEVARFWVKVDRRGPTHKRLGRCWLWTAATDRDGYGQFVIKRKNHKAHRVAYAVFGMLLRASKQIDHLCRNPACVRPTHLEPVTAKTNTMRSEAITARFARADRCKNGHLFTAGNTMRRPISGRRCRIWHNQALLRSWHKHKPTDPEVQTNPVKS